MSPRSSQQLDELREQRKAEILEAALELFARQGFHNTSIEQIRKQAGVSKGLIYNYFDKKEDLVTEIVMGELAQGERVLEEMGKLSTAQDRLRYVIDLSFDMMVENLAHTKLVSALSLQLDLPEFAHLRELLVGRIQGIFPLTEQLMRDLGFDEPEAEGRAFAALLDGIGIQYITLGEVIDLNQMKQYLYQRYLGEALLPNESDDLAPEPEDSHPSSYPDHDDQIDP